MERNTYSFKSLVRSVKLAALGLAAVGFSYQANAQMSGSYTIDKGSSASATNFKSFTSAVQAMRGVTRSDGGPSLGSGVNGAVVFNVAQGSGPYNEQVEIPSISGASSSNTITFMGNGETVNYNGSSTNPAVFKLNGADYFTFKDLHVQTLNTTYAMGFWLLNSADHNTIEDCKINISSSTYTGSAYSCGIGVVGVVSSFTSYTTGGYKGRWNTIKNNEIYGSSSNNGMYVAIMLNGNSSHADHGTLIEGNYIHNFYVYGIWNYYYFAYTSYIDNIVVRGTKPSLTTFYGIYNYYSPSEIFKGNYIADASGTTSAYTYSTYALYDYYGTSTGSQDALYYNNIINLDNGYYRMGMYCNQYYATNKYMYHNTVYMHSYYGYGYGIYAYTYSYNKIEYKNNIIDADFQSYPSTFYNIYNYSYGAPVCDGNVMPRNTNQSYHNTAYLYSTSLGGGQCLSYSDYLNNVHNPDPHGTDIYPTYVDVANGDLTPTVIDLDGLGVPTSVNVDINGDPRSATNPDPGAIEFDIPINVSAINFPTSICQGSTDDVEVTITNNSTLNLKDFYVVFTIDGKVISTEQFTNTINAGTSSNFTFNTQVLSDVTGNFTLAAYVRGKQPVITVPYSVNPAPVGSYVQQGSTFQGAFNSGDAQDPDIVAYGDKIQYNIMPPTGYSNNQFNTGSGWSFDMWELITPGGTSAGSQHTKTNPAGSNNAVSSFTPVIGQSDSTFLLRYAIKSNANGCVAPTVERQVFVAPRPVAGFAAAAVCEGSPMHFDNNTVIASGSADYMWRFGDGDSTVLINPDHVYPGPGTYTVELIAISNYGYMNTYSTTVTVNENPTAEFSSSNVCEGTATPFTDGSIIPAGTPTYEWDFGDGSAMGSGPNPTHQYTATGVYEVTMRVTASGCTGETSNYVTYAPMPVADFTPSVVSCNNDPVGFANNSTLSSGQMGYSWDFGDNMTSTSMSPTHEYMSFGTIDVMLTVTTDFGCQDTKTKQITLTEAPRADFNSMLLCDKDNADFTNMTTEPAGATTTYEWVFSDGSTYNSKDVSRSFPSVGSYTVELTAYSDNGCTDMFTKTISVDEEPTAQFYADDVCEGADVMFRNASTGNNGNYTNSWDFGGGMTSTAQDPTMALPVGSHTVTLTVTTPSGCTSDVTKGVTVTANPTVTNITVESAQMGDGSMNVIANVTPVDADYIIFWGDGGHAEGTANSGQITETYQYLVDGKFPVTVRLYNGECNIEAKSSASVVRTGVMNVVEGQLVAYPNPTHGKFNLDLSGLNAANVQIEVHAANGQLVNGNVNINGSVAQLDLSGAAAGVYLVTVTTDSGVYNARVTLNK